jgi:hypothetical protein
MYSFIKTRTKKTSNQHKYQERLLLKKIFHIKKIQEVRSKELEGKISDLANLLISYLVKVTKKFSLKACSTI